MKQMFGNATVAWNEQEILRREALIREIPLMLHQAWRDLNWAVQMERCETPILTPPAELKSHIECGFELIPAGALGYLRPETTAGTYAMFDSMFPNAGQIRKRLPFCLWQVGCSFRDEAKPDTMRASKLRLRQFYQMEFQLFTADDTKAPYLETALEVLTKRYGGEIVIADELPHYSEKTLDWQIDGLEVAGCSIRTDWKHGKVFEVAIGLDRLVSMQISEENKISSQNKWISLQKQQ